eukprot:scaffold414_cov109-Cylindrotheca_fusiformis.AAC.10
MLASRRTCVTGNLIHETSQNPPWQPSYGVLDSLISMQYNHSGFSSPSRGADFGIISYDWSNAKDVWAQAKPMSCEELLVEQVELTKQAGGKRIFVYRNFVKALPWFQSVRDKLNDPSGTYDGFFLRFDTQRKPYHVPECAPENKSKCSQFYHDQLQTPQVPTNPDDKPDGKCNEYCDCGPIHPCGEYVFDHRNGTMLRRFIIDELLLGPTAVGHPAIDGVFVDDYWCSDLLCEASGNNSSECPCQDPVQGPTEMDKHACLDMGLSDEDIRDITLEWKQTMKEATEALLKHGAYTWSLMLHQENANASPFLLEASNCVRALREACSPTSIWQRYPILFGFTVNGTALTQLSQDLAFFLLARGPYAYAGWGVWGMTWPFNPEPRHGQLPPMPHGVPLPQEFYHDFGVPLNNMTCIEELPGVFAREWSRASVKLDCNQFSAEIRLMTREGGSQY